MKAVMSAIPPGILEQRKLTGADRWDEMWEGVLHMPPMPTVGHQDFEGALEAYLRLHWAQARGGKVYHNVNVASWGGWPNNYRIPDLVLLTEECEAINQGEYLEGPPDVVVEIESPGDETREKMPFYAALGVAELWIIDRDTRTPELHVLSRGRYKQKSQGKDSWLRSEVTGLELRSAKGNRLGIRARGDEATRQELPSA